jgi:hypothetical protein
MFTVVPPPSLLGHSDTRTHTANIKHKIILHKIQYYMINVQIKTHTLHKIQYYMINVHIKTHTCTQQPTNFLTCTRQ